MTQFLQENQKSNLSFLCQFPCSSLVDGLHRGEQQNIADGGAVGEQHDQAVHTEAQAARGGQTVLQCVDVIVIHLSLAIGLDGLALGDLTLKAALLVDGVVQPYSVQSMKYSKRSVKAGSSGLRLASGLISTG